MIRLPCIFFLLCSCATHYKVGVSRVSLEPDSTIVSLALGGYGAPAAGRFTITWQDLGTTDVRADSIVSWGGREYSLRADNTLYYRAGSTWMKIGRNNEYTYTTPLKGIAVLNNHLYGIGRDGHLYKARHSSDGNLSASAMAIQKGRQKVVLMGVDLVSFNYSLASGIKQRIFKETGIPPAAILINASHTHFAPTMKEALSYEPFMQHPDSVYLQQVTEHIIKAVQQAVQNLKPARLHFSRGQTNIGRNRSTQNGPYDNVVDVLQANSSSQKNIVFVTGCHAVFKNAGAEGFTISANFPGVTRAELEKDIHQAIFIQGCAGDINPVSDDHRQTGLQLANDIKAIKPQQRIHGAISSYFDTIFIPGQAWDLEKVKKFRDDNITRTDLESVKNVRWADNMLKLYANNKVPTTWPVYVQTINVGNWKLVGLSREAVTEYGPAIRALWPGQPVTVAGYCNDVPGYLPAARHVQATTYEGYHSFFWNSLPLLPPAGLKETVVNAIKKTNR